MLHFFYDATETRRAQRVQHARLAPVPRTVPQDSNVNATHAACNSTARTSYAPAAALIQIISVAHMFTARRVAHTIDYCAPLLQLRARGLTRGHTGGLRYSPRPHGAAAQECSAKRCHFSVTCI